MEIKHKSVENKGKFYIQIDGRQLGRMSYEWTGPREITIMHTEVDPELEGQGAGKQLVKAAVEFAREEGLKIKAECPFARSVLEKMEEYGDVYVRG